MSWAAVSDTAVFDTAVFDTRIDRVIKRFMAIGTRQLYT